MEKHRAPVRRTAAAIVLAAASAWAGGAAAETLSPATLQAVQALAQGAAGALAASGMRIEVVPGTLDPRLKLAPCARIEPYLPPGVRPWGRARIGLRCRGGAVAWNVYLPVTIEVWGPGVVVDAALPAGAVLEAGQLRIAPVDWAAEATPPLAAAEALVGRTLARALAAGEAPRIADLKPREWFASGETVEVVARGNGYAVSTRGEALMRGVEGRQVRVRTEGGRIVTGWPTAPGRVDVTL
ncbi:flagella basal body P-ring formation protein FlgA [Rubrivivax gelatinosus]|nr:flagella basal body P-ring formation protein FlgA [Rubrivivax gelatinosus]